MYRERELGRERGSVIFLDKDNVLFAVLHKTDEQFAPDSESRSEYVVMLHLK